MLPATGYGRAQLWDREATINRSGAQVVVIDAPADLGRLLTLRAPAVRVWYEIEDRAAPTLRELITAWVSEQKR